MRNLSAHALGLLFMGLGLFGAAAVPPMAYPGAFDGRGYTTNAMALILMLVITEVFAMFAGWITARLVSDHRPGQALLMATIALAIAVFVGAVRWAAAPSWYYVASWCLLPAAAYLGAAAWERSLRRKFEARSRRVAAVVLVVGSAGMLTGCGSTGGATGTSPVPVTVSAQGTAGTVGMSSMTMMVGSTGQKTTLAASREAVWAQLPGAYESLGLPLSVKDDTRFRLGNDQIKARRQINGLQMRTIVDCGSDLNGEKAESYEIKLTIETVVEAGTSPNSSDVTTTVSALGRSPNFGNNDINCSTKGELERRILRYVRTQLLLTGK